MMAAAKAKSHCHEIRQQQLLAGDYDLDYSSDGLGEAEDPCEEAVKQAKQIALLAAAEQRDSLEAEVQTKAKAGAQQPAGMPIWGTPYQLHLNHQKPHHGELIASVWHLSCMWLHQGKTLDVTLVLAC